MKDLVGKLEKQIILSLYKVLLLSPKMSRDSLLNIIKRKLQKKAL